ncbi:MAG: hypothetical protein U0T81_00855 [Saprospiraceae bacterium]
MIKYIASGADKIAQAGSFQKNWAGLSGTRNGWTNMKCMTRPAEV